MKPHNRLLSKAPSIAAYGLLTACLWYLGSSLLGYAIDGDRAKESFLLLREMRMQPTFADLKWIIVIGECGTRLQNIYQSAAASCANYGYGTPGGGFPESGYPPMATWLLRWLQFPAGQSAALALVSGVTFVAVLLSVSKALFRSTWTWPLWLSIILVSFPVQLVLERGNLDILIFLALAATAACISIKNRAYWLPSGILAFLAVSLKLYPVAGFAGWLAFGQVAESHGCQVSRAVKAAIFSGCLIGLALSLPWMFGSVELHGEGGMNSFGLKAIGYINAPLVLQLGVGSARWIIRGLIVTKLLALVVGAVFTARVRLHSALQHHFQAMGDGHYKRFFHGFYLIASWTWLGCYILTISYDYRHIFMLPSLFLLLSMVDRPADPNPSQYALAWILIVASMIIILFPLVYYNVLNHYEIIAKFFELSKEILILPFYAGALAMLLTRHRFPQSAISALVRDS